MLSARMPKPMSKGRRRSQFILACVAEKAADAAVIAARLTVEQQEHDRLVAFANFYIASRGLHSAQVDLTTAERKSEHAELSRSQLDDEYQTGLTDVQTAFIAREKAYGRTRPPDKDRVMRLEYEVQCCKSGESGRAEVRTLQFAIDMEALVKTILEKKIDGAHGNFLMCVLVANTLAGIDRNNPIKPSEALKMKGDLLLFIDENREEIDGAIEYCISVSTARREQSS